MNLERQLPVVILACVLVSASACGGGGSKSSGDGGGAPPTGNHPPNAAITGTQISVETGQLFAVSGSCFDPDGDPVSWRWSAPGSLQESGTTEAFRTQYPVGGTFTVTLTCTDARGDVDSDSVVIKVASRPPQATVYKPGSSDATGAVGYPVVFDAACSHAESILVTGSWDFGGGAVESSSGSVYRVLFSSPGDYQTRFTCTDERGLTASVAREVRILPAATPYGLSASVDGGVRAERPFRATVVLRNAGRGQVFAEGIPVSLSTSVPGALSGNTTAVTNATGFASFEGLVLSRSAIGSVVLIASSPGLVSDSVRVTVEEPFDVEVRYLSSLDASTTSAIDAARARISQVVAQGLSDVPVDMPASPSCENVDVTTEVDDLLVLVAVRAIDGTGGVLAQASPCVVRRGATLRSGLPAVSRLVIDSADLENARLPSVLLHEFLHALGFGALWNADGNELLFGDATTDPYFVGDRGEFHFRSDNNGWYHGGVPVEANGGPGTAYVHWRESVLGRELMTGFLSGATQPLSATTIGSLEDLGYNVDYAASDPFEVSAAALRSEDDEPGVWLENDVLPGPFFEVTEDGVLAPL